MIFGITLFLGFPKIPPFNQEISETNPYLVSMLTSGGIYLTQIKHQDKEYLGKFVKKMATLGELEHLEANIVSLLQLLAPHHSTFSLRLFAAPDGN